jgi:hypothetical protein
LPTLKGDRLYVLFSQDTDFSRSKFKQQLAVMRGQVLNLRRALEERRTPEQLVKMPTGVCKWAEHANTRWPPPSRHNRRFLWTVGVYGIILLPHNPLIPVYP